jgi:tetratricopeptide (TPR) repeat protein
MLVVRKGGGRNINNDRLVYINVDDNPQPIPELRRLLDINLGFLWQQRIGPLRSAGKLKEAREGALLLTRYNRDAQSYITLGSLDYALGDKPAALADFRKAIELDPAVRGRFQASQGAPPANGGRGQMLRPVLEDQEFLKEVLK